MPRQKLDWTKPKSFQTAAQRLATNYNSFLKKSIPSEVAKEKLQALKDDLGFVKKNVTKSFTDDYGKTRTSTYMKNNIEDPVFDRVFDVDKKTGKLTVKNDDAAQQIYAQQAAKAKLHHTKAFSRRIQGEDVIGEADSLKGQTLRNVYESTPTSKEYFDEIKSFIVDQYSDYSENSDKYAGDTIKDTVVNIKKDYPDMSNTEARAEAKRIMTHMKEAIYKEMADRAIYNLDLAASLSREDNIFGAVSDALRDGSIAVGSDDYELAMGIVFHDGRQSTYADLNALQGLAAKY